MAATWLSLAYCDAKVKNWGLMALYANSPGSRMRSVRGLVAALTGIAIALWAPLVFGKTGTTGAAEATAPAPSAIVIGFLGGYVGRDNAHHAEVQLAQSLREKYPTSVDIETYGNHDYEDAHRAILRLLDANHDGHLSDEEKRHARIVLYGHSWGGAAAVLLARELDQDGIPVALTVQIDSVSKMYKDDSMIPANVQNAVNYYQPHGIVSGLREITAADPARTHIIGNFRYDYSNHPLHCEGYPWWDNVVFRAHTEIECDPRVWSQVETLIQSYLPPTKHAGAQPAADSAAK
ncbi:MAG: hypothetical protein WBF56_11040 [Candidatus Acidiferrales bacterium]